MRTGDCGVGLGQLTCDQTKPAWVRPELHLPEVALGPHAQILQDKPNTILVFGVDETERAGREAADQIACKHALRLAAADRETLRHADEGSLEDSRRVVSAALRRKLRDSLHIGTEFVGIILARRAVCPSVRSYIVASCPALSAQERVPPRGVGHTLIRRLLYSIMAH